MWRTALVPAQQHAATQNYDYCSNPLNSAEMLYKHSPQPVMRNMHQPQGLTVKQVSLRLIGNTQLTYNRDRIP